LTYSTFNLLREKSLHILFIRQFELVFGDKEIVVHSCQGILYQRLIFLGT
jgi:hypothetical protein